MSESTPDEALSHIKEFAKMADASYVIVSASIIEDWLTMAIKSKLRPGMSLNFEARIFRNYGPLSTFSSRIDIAYAMEIISDEMFDDLRAIKDVRNAFAHAKQVIFFGSDELTPLFQKFRGWTHGASQIDLFDAKIKKCIFRFQSQAARSALVRALLSPTGPEPTGESQARDLLPDPGPAES